MFEKYGDTELSLTFVIEDRFSHKKTKGIMVDHKGCVIYGIKPIHKEPYLADEFSWVTKRCGYESTVKNIRRDRGLE